MQRRDQRPANTSYYARHRDEEIKRVRTRQRATVVFLRELRARPCQDCGQAFAPHQMDFDHREPAHKSFRVTGGAASLATVSTSRAEVAKCDIVCANCHRIRTARVNRARSVAQGHQGVSAGLDRKRAVWRAQARLLDELRDVPCADCGGRFPSCAMDFDHRVDTIKAFTVTRMVGRSGTPRILAEIAKCDIVCANCHRVRTLVRRDGESCGRE